MHFFRPRKTTFKTEKSMKSNDAFTAHFFDLTRNDSESGGVVANSLIWLMKVLMLNRSTCCQTHTGIKPNGITSPRTS